MKNIVESPNCSCGAVETTKHYLFDCPRFSVSRRVLLDSIANICIPDVTIMLYGDKSLSSDMNETIFSAVQRFISDSKRFDL